MSAGNFLLSKYEAGSGTIYAIRVQPETLALTIGGVANTAPAGEIDGDGSVKVSAGRRSFGVLPRRVAIKFGDTVPTGYQPNGRITLPWLQSATFEPIKRGNTGTYLGSPITVVSANNEQVR